MAIRFLINTLLFSFLLICKSSFANDDEFPIATGDRIIIEVYNERDLRVATKVGKTGVVRLPLVGDILVTGKTPKQLGLELEKAYLDGYLVNPSISVVIELHGPFYIRGAVRLSGTYPYAFDLTVDQAIAVAGGLIDRASKSEWYIIRHEERIKASKETLVLPGDIIEIKESLF